MFLQCGKKHFGGFFFIALKYRVSKVAFAGASLSVPVDSVSFSGSFAGPQVSGLLSQCGMRAVGKGRQDNQPLPMERAAGRQGTKTTTNLPSVHS